MPGEGGKEVKRLQNPIPYLLVLACLMALICLCSARIMSAQVLRQADVQIIAGTLGVPCEPGDMQFGFFPCPPVDKQGVFLHVRADDWKDGAFDGYLVTLTYRTAAGELKTATCGGDNPCPKRERTWGKEWDDGWRAVAFPIGRVASGPLSGITVESVAVAKVPASTVITIGKTTFGEPK